MNEFKGTPGPWEAFNNQDQALQTIARSGFDPEIESSYANDQLIVAGIWSDSDTALANARLIAAAPELLAACIAAINNSNKWLKDQGAAYRSKECQAVYDQVESAINKALGKEIVTP